MSRILIIEDEEAIADLEKDYLELSGFEVEIETRGDRGLTAALQKDFDLIVLDLMLPGIDGFDVCRKIREKKDIPILMVSAKKDDIDKQARSPMMLWRSADLRSTRPPAVYLRTGRKRISPPRNLIC